MSWRSPAIHSLCTVHALGQLLAQQPQPASAQRTADGQLFSPRGRSGYDQTRRVQTGDEQETACGRQEHVQRRLVAVDDAVEERQDVRTVSNRLIGMIGMKALLDRVDLAEAFSRRGARSETRDNPELMIA